ncbi:MAG TPA: (4Fe-4S)-binding protein [Lentisphaeria bacterium]|nr:MAG: (4Fe-4S)-binding protein [Lentisphaerae bacterium GWF2_38_69]HBM15543.1 (4Fe-4S)-binding protein [Lentisphaeria bacterium]
MNTPLNIAVASGKGGTGKTTLSVSLAIALGESVTLLDCDVEEPNCHIFIKRNNIGKEKVSVLIPKVEKTRCNKCGNCAKICRYNAIVSLPSGPLIFPELCHSCGGCARICPTGAITEKKEPIGVIESSLSGNIKFFQGIMHVGKPISPPLIKAVKMHKSPDHLTIIDCPPGTSCPMITAVKDSDFIILVTEPTPFGLNDLKLAVETSRKLKIPFAVVLNRSDSGDNRVDEYCKNESIPVLLRIPEMRCIAEAYSNGKTIIDAVPIIRGQLISLLNDVVSIVKAKGKINAG